LEAADVERIRQELLEAEARRLQPHYVRAWFMDSFERLGGRIIERERHRFEITRVPEAIRQRDRTNGTGNLVLPRYERVTFDKALTRIEGCPVAQLLAPGHPLIEAVLELMLERHAGLLRQGALLIDESGRDDSIRVLLFLEHAIVDGNETAAGRHIVSRRFEFIEIASDGNAHIAGYAPYLDYRPATDDERMSLAATLEEPWLQGDVERLGIDHAIEMAVPAHLAEMRLLTETRVAKIRAAVRDRLTKEIAYWDHRAVELREQAIAGKQPRINPDRAQSRADELSIRLKIRLADLDRDQQLSALPPVAVGGALIVPASRLNPHTDETYPPLRSGTLTELVERRAVDAVIRIEQTLGRKPREMDPNNPGFDIKSESPDGTLLFIEVKGRVAGAETFVVTRNEILHSLNVPDTWVLALVEVSPDGPPHDNVRYLRRPFGETVHLPFATTSAVLSWRDYWNRGGHPS
jgi:hypothetical protein